MINGCNSKAHGNQSEYLVSRHLECQPPNGMRLSCPIDTLQLTTSRTQFYVLRIIRHGFCAQLIESTSQQLCSFRYGKTTSRIPDNRLRLIGSVFSSFSIDPVSHIDFLLNRLSAYTRLTRSAVIDSNQGNAVKDTMTYDVYPNVPFVDKVEDSKQESHLGGANKTS